MKYPNITVELVGEDGNALFIIGKVSRTLKNNGVNKEEINQFKKEAMSGDYDDLLQTTMRWVNVE